MIIADSAEFPNNIVDIIATRAELIDADLFVTRRPLRNTDPNQSVGVYAGDWQPQDNSKEFKGLGNAHASTPTLSRYRIIVQSFIKDMDQERGLNVHAVLSRMVRSMLYTDEPLRVALAGLSVNLDGSTERTQRWGVTSQKFFSNELSGDWLYLSILEFWLETETI